MKFRNIEDKHNEELCGVNIAVAGGGCTVSWVYPFKCSGVCVLAVPFSEVFDEARAGEYRAYTAKPPETKITVDEICNFAVFAVDGEGALIRQANNFYSCPIRVSYRFTEESVPTAKGFMGKFFTKPKTHRLLTVSSNVDVKGRKVLYRIPGEDGVFCLPFDLPAGTEIKTEVETEVELFAAEECVKVQRQNV